MNKNLGVVVLSIPLTLSSPRAGGAQLRVPGLGTLKPVAVQNDYRGSIEFVWEVQGPAGSMKLRWSATVNASGVQCTGAEDEVSQGQLTHTDLRGPGLFQIRFEPARGQYTFEGACPNAAHPTESSWTDTDSSYEQRGKEGETLKGSWDEPSDVDPANNQTGRKMMSWNLCYKCQPPTP